VVVGLVEVDKSIWCDDMVTSAKKDSRMLWVLLVAPCGKIQETNSSNKKGFREEALFYVKEVCLIISQWSSRRSGAWRRPTFLR